MKHRLFVFFAAAAFVLFFASGARANGRLPASNAITFDPSSANTLYLRTTFGLLVSTDGGHAWDWICDRAVGLKGPEDPSIGVFQDGTVASATFEGLGVTFDHACTFNFVGGPLANQIFIDIAVRKSLTSSAVAVTSGYANATDDAGNALFSSKIFISTDDGKTWPQKGQPIDPSILIETIDWSEVDPLRMYVSGVRYNGAIANGLVLESDDGGGTWIEHALPLLQNDAGGGERAPFIAALDPKNAGTIYVRTQGSQTDPARLLVSKDSGATWKTVLTLMGPMQGFALSEDGTKIFAGGPTMGDGLYAASTADFVFTKKSSLQVQCLAYRTGSLWACSNEFSGFIAGVSTDDGATFDPRLHLSGVRGPLACAAQTPTAQLCGADWPAQAGMLGITLDGADASTSGGSDGGAPSTNGNGKSSGGGCSLDLLGAPTAASSGIMATLVIVLGLRARKKSSAAKSTDPREKQPKR